MPELPVAEDPSWSADMVGRLFKLGLDPSRREAEGAAFPEGEFNESEEKAAREGEVSWAVRDCCLVGESGIFRVIVWPRNAVGGDAQWRRGEKDQKQPVGFWMSQNK